MNSTPKRGRSNCHRFQTGLGTLFVFVTVFTVRGE
jgi:hypothetical protein